MFSEDLESAFAINYQPLQSVLSAQQWREADRLTWQRQGQMTSFDELFSCPIPRGGLPAMFPRTLETPAWLSLLQRVNHCARTN